MRCRCSNWKMPSTLFSSSACEGGVLGACCTPLASSRCTVCTSSSTPQILTLCIHQILVLRPHNRWWAHGSCMHALRLLTTPSFYVLLRCSIAVLALPACAVHLFRCLPAFFPNPPRRCFLIPSALSPFSAPSVSCLSALLLACFASSVSPFPRVE